MGASMIAKPASHYNAPHTDPFPHSLDRKWSFPLGSIRSTQDPRGSCWLVFDSNAREIATMPVYGPSVRRQDGDTANAYSTSHPVMILTSAGYNSPSSD